MDFINLLLSAIHPSGMWASIIFGLEKAIGTYGWTLIVVTILIKIVLTPTDFVNRYITKVNTRKMGVLQPELNKLQKLYGSNKDMLNRKTMELYKRENYSIVGTCFGMLISMGLTMLVFFTLFGSLNKISSYKIYNEFEILNTTYYEIYDAGYTEGMSEENLTALIQESQESVITKYGEIKTSFLWIKNIWRADTSQSIVPDYDSFKSLTKKLVLEEGSSIPTEEEYNTVMSSVSDSYAGWNGFYVLTILAALATYISTKMPEWIAKISAKRKKVVYTPVQQNKILSYIMPLVMALFTLFYNAAFAIYIVSGALFAMLIQPILTIVVDKIDKKIAKKEEEKKKVSYSRK